MDDRQRAKRGEPLAFIYWAAEQETDECILWPFGRSTYGYGTVRFGGIKINSSAAVCIIVHGKCPSYKHESAHKCGIRLCVNPRHLYWATRTENNRDRWKHGTMPRGETQGSCKLTEPEVLEIYTAPGTLRGISANYSVGPTAIREIKIGHTWRWLTND